MQKNFEDHVYDFIISVNLCNKRHFRYLVGSIHQVCIIHYKIFFHRKVLVFRTLVVWPSHSALIYSKNFGQVI